MRWHYSIPLRLRSLFGRQRVERDLDDEVRFYLEEKTADGIMRGLTPEQARREANSLWAALNVFETKTIPSRGSPLSHPTTSTSTLMATWSRSLANMSRATTTIC
jgi:hypothetical protein